MKLDPTTLAGQHVQLQPLSLDHANDLRAAVSIDDLWKLTITIIPAPNEMESYIETTLKAQADGQILPFAIVHRETGHAIGSTRYLNLRLKDRGLEIGGTWLATPWQRTTVNTEAKYLLLRYAFESLQCLRVELKTDVLNERSRRAIERIGGKQEGIFRKHMVMPGGRIRDTVYYSIIDEDWPSVKTRLEARMNG
jgi:RimJ/RimL family protein N-acetyltransferase